MPLRVSNHPDRPLLPRNHRHPAGQLASPDVLLHLDVIIRLPQGAQYEPKAGCNAEAYRSSERYGDADGGAVLAFVAPVQPGQCILRE